MNSLGSVIATALPRRPTDAKAKLDQPQGKRELVRSNRQIKAENLAVVTEYLAIAEAVDQALDKLSEQLFGQIIKVLEEMLTLALHDVLEQTIVLKAIREYKRGRDNGLPYRAQRLSGRHHEGAGRICRQRFVRRATYVRS